MLLPPALGFSPHPPVSVYGTGVYHTIAAFLDSRNHTLHYFSSLRITYSDRPADLPAGLLPRLPRYSHSQDVLSFCVPTVLIIHGTGISTCCPSTTLFSLALGPDLPRADQLYSGNLGYSAWRIPTSISLCVAASKPTSSCLTNPTSFSITHTLGPLGCRSGLFPFDCPTYLVQSDSRTSFMRHSEFDIISSFDAPLGIQCSTSAKLIRG